VSAIFLPRRWRHQPQGAVEVEPGWSHVWLPGPKRNLVTNVGDASFATAFSASPEGLAARYSGNTTDAPTDRFYPDSGDFTAFAFIKTTDTAAATLQVCFYQSSSSAENGFATGTTASELHFGTRNAQWSFCQDRNNTAETLEGGTVTTKPTMVVARQQGNVLRLFVDGVLAATRVATTDTFAGTSNFLRYARTGSGSTTRYWRGDLYLFACANRAMSDAEIRERSDWRYSMFRAPSHRIYFDLGASAPAAELDADALASAQAAGSLTTAIRMAGASIVATTSTGSLSTGVQLEGAAASLTQAGGVLTAQIRLQGAALAKAVAAAGLTNAIRLAAQAQAGAQATGDLTAPGAPAALAGNATAAALAAGSITTIIRFEAAAVAKAIAQGTLAGGAAQLAGSALSSALASGDLATAIRLAAAALGSASASGALTAPGAPAGLSADATVLAIAEGGLTTGIALQGAAASVVQASGTLDVAITFEAQAFASAMASGVLSTQIRMEAAAVASALARADLTGGMPVVPPAERTIRVRAQTRVIGVRAQTRLIPA